MIFTISVRCTTAVLCPERWFNKIIYQCLNTIDRLCALHMTPPAPFQHFLFFDRTCGPSFRAGKGQKLVKSSKMVAQGQWFGLETILIDYISGYYFSEEVYMNSNKFIPLNGPQWTSGPSFPAAKGPKIVKIVKNGGWRSMICIRNDLDRLYQWLLLQLRDSYEF